MTVYAIHEENHGLIGVCAVNSRAIVDYLADTEWIDENYKIFIKKFNQWVSLRSYFGENWVDRLKGMTTDEIEDILGDSFYFERFEVYGVD